MAGRASRQDRGVPLVFELRDRVPAPTEGWRAVLRSGENWLITAALAVMVLLPLTEALLRKLFGTGISGAAPIVQHLVLIVGMLIGQI